MLLELTENCFRMRFLLILFIDMVKKKQQIKKENRLILCQSRNLVTGVAICCDKISWPWVIALKATNEWLALLWHAEWPPGSSCKDLMTGVKLTRGIMLFSKHDSSQISIQLAQWGLKDRGEVQRRKSRPRPQASWAGLLPRNQQSFTEHLQCARLCKGPWTSQKEKTGTSGINKDTRWSKIDDFRFQGIPRAE